MRPEHDAREIGACLERIEGMLAWPAERLYVIVEEISRWSPAQQVEHTLISLDRFFDVLAILEEGTDERIRADGRPRLAARAILLTGRIPRGRAEAPDLVRPEPVPARAALRERCSGTLAMLAAQVMPRIGRLAEIKGTYPHGLLGFFNAAQWLRFARVHTAHHLAIVADIDRSGMRGLLEPDPLAPLGDAP